MRSDHGGGVPRSSTFAQALEELKREGANLLLVGEATPAAHAAASARLMGDSEDPRRRLFVFTRGADACTGLPAETDPSTVRVVDQAPESGIERDLPGGIERTTVDATMLTPLAMAVVDAIEEFDDDAGGLDPAELRICFDSVTSLFRDHNSENVFRMLHLVTSSVRKVSGMGHFHLRLDRDSDPVHLLEPMFDAVVEMRDREGSPQQRWHLRDQGVTSDWTSLG